MSEVNYSKSMILVRHTTKVLNVRLIVRITHWTMVTEG